MQHIEITFKIPRSIGGDDLSMGPFQMTGKSKTSIGTVDVLQTDKKSMELIWLVDRQQLTEETPYQLEIKNLSIPAASILKATKSGDSGISTLEDVINACSLFAQSAEASEKKAVEYKDASAISCQRAEEAADRAEETTGLNIDGKADKVLSAVPGHFAALDRNGNLTDSGKKPDDFALANHSHGAGDFAPANHTHSAANISIAPIDGLTATNVQEAIAANFQSVVNGKSMLETAIIDKGGSVSKVNDVATFDELSQGVQAIEATGTGEINDNLPPPVTGFYGSNESTADEAKIRIHWTKPVSDYYSGVAIVRKSGVPPTGLTDGVKIYDGVEEQFLDAVQLDQTYGYRAYPYNAKGQYQTDITKSAFTFLACNSVELGSVVRVGSKIIYGTYKGEPLKWFVCDINHTGYPENAVTLTTERAIAYKKYGLSSNGNSCWTYENSEIKQWLESNEMASDTSVYKENGFLYEFTLPEKEIIVPTSLPTAHTKAGSAVLYFANSKGGFLPSANEVYAKRFYASGGPIYPGIRFKGYVDKIIPVAGLGKTLTAWREANPTLIAEPPQEELDKIDLLWTRDVEASSGVPHYTNTNIYDHMAMTVKIWIKPYINIKLQSKCRPAPNSDGYFELAL